MFDFGRFVDVFADKLGQSVAITARNEARRNARVDTGNLRNSIRADKTGESEREVSANTEYAAAQEWGRPDLPNYGFTPYMRPGAKEAVNQIPKLAREAAAIAARRAR